MTEEVDDPLAATGAAADEPARPGNWRRRLRRMALDVTPLRDYPAFRRLWAGEAISFVGTQMTAVAVPVQVYRITESSLAVGMLGLVAFVPLVVFGLLGGSVADATDRRRTAIFAASGLSLISIALLLQALAGLRSVWLLYLLVAFQSALFAIDSPTRRAIVPRLIPVSQIPAATGLSQVLFNFGTVVGPLVAAGIIRYGGIEWVYAVDVLTFAAALAALRGLPPLPPAGEVMAPGVRSVVAGLKFLRGQKIVLTTFLVDLNAMIFGMPRALFPALAIIYGAGEDGAGLLYASPAFGALVAALLGGWFTRIRRQGLAVLLAVAGWGAAIVAFGLARSLVWACVFLAIAGAADMVSAVFRTAILQAATPDDMRGRMGGVFMVVVAGGPRLGDVEAGAVASMTSVQFSVVSGGIACLVGVLLVALAIPRFAKYDAEHPTA